MTGTDPTVVPGDRGDPPIPTPHQYGAGRVRYVAAVVVVVVAAVVLLVANNKLGGYNIRGEVHCQRGNVTGVFIEPELLPRLWPNGPEVQAGFAKWESAGSNSATFHYWLPLGGRYSAHAGCFGGDGPGSWGTDNWSPITDARHPVVTCDNPENHHSPAVTTTNACLIQ